MKSVLLIDLSGIFWSAWHATADEELGAAYEKTIGKIVSLSAGFDAVAVCCDRGPYKRKALSSSYKATRDAPPPQAVEQLERVKRRLDADGFLLWEAPGFEADDIIATACMGLSEHTITIASGDKDLLALVSDEPPEVKVVSPATGKLYTAEGVREKFGVPPWRIGDLLALMGDKSDNVAGVPGIGEKRGAELLTEFGDLDGVLAATVSGKVGEAIRANEDKVRLARQLVTLMLDAPIKPLEIFEKREPKPIGPAGEWDEEKLDDVLPPVKGQELGNDVARAQLQNALSMQQDTRGIGVQAIALAPQTQVLAVRPAEWSMALEPNDARAAFTVAKYFHDSRLYPQLQSQAALFTTILRGRALGLDAATACAMFHNVEGRLTMHAELIIGLVLRSGKAQYFECIETNDTKATWATKRVGGSGREIVITWDMDRAVKAGLVTKTANGFSGISRSGRSTNWDKYPRTMLRWRAGTELAHACYPEVVSGLVAPDEATDEADAA